MRSDRAAQHANAKRISPFICLEVDGGIEDVIQMAAAVIPGGALVDIEGNLVGINTTDIGPAAGNVGIAFAIPALMVRSVADQLARFGKVSRSQLGVAVQDHPAAMSAALQSDIPPEAMVADVVQGSPAVKVGLQRADVMIAVNGRPVVNAAQLRTQMGLV